MASRCWWTFQASVEASRGLARGMRLAARVLPLAGALRPPRRLRKYRLLEGPMTVVIDTLSAPRPRHPEKQHRPDAPLQRKPDWIRVKAPVGRGYADTQRIVRENGLHTVCEEA